MRRFKSLLLLVVLLFTLITIEGKHNFVVNVYSEGKIIGSEIVDIGDRLDKEEIVKIIDKSDMVGYKISDIDVNGEKLSYKNLLSYEVYNDLNINIKHKICEYSINFIGFNGDIISSQVVKFGEMPDIPLSEDIEGYTFEGWDEEVVHACEDKSYRAEYLKNVYTVKFLDWDDKVLSEADYTYGDELKVPSNPERENQTVNSKEYKYEFTGWSPEISNIVSSNVEYVAQYKQVEVVRCSFCGEVGHSYSECSKRKQQSEKAEKIESADNISNNSCSYCGSSSHTYSYCPVRAVDNGAIGRLVLPSVGINVACYKSREQSVTDAVDSASYFDYGVQFVIGDHQNQGFYKIKSCKVGDIAYIDNGKTQDKYICTSLISGHNNGKALLDSEYNDIKDMNSGGITLYTCNGSNWRDVTIVFFQKCS